MLEDRKVLVEKEIQKLTRECADLYLNAIRDGGEIIMKVYKENLQTLSQYQSDLIKINEMLAQGKPDIK